MSEQAEIKVIQAVYGAVQGTKEVTEIVQKMVNGKQYSFVANNQTLGPDPAPGHDKHFAMNYTVGTSTLAFACKENETVNLRTEEVPPVPPGPIKVIAAAYGAIDQKDSTQGARDVTAFVQALLDATPVNQVSFTPNNDLFGDPFPGPRKNFGMTYAAKDLTQRTSIASDENQKVTIKVT
jgi:hypothetical protein